MIIPDQSTLACSSLVKMVVRESIDIVLKWFNLEIVLNGVVACVEQLVYYCPQETVLTGCYFPNMYLKLCLLLTVCCSVPSHPSVEFQIQVFYLHLPFDSGVFELDVGLALPLDKDGFRLVRIDLDYRNVHPPCYGVCVSLEFVRNVFWMSAGR